MQYLHASTQQALLVIADISGFTQFMKSQERATPAAMRVVVELLKSVVAAAAPPLRLAEVEGDALFFYAFYKNQREAASVKQQVKRFFQAFAQTLQRLCLSNSCTVAARSLRLKVILHAGEVALEHIHGFDKLFGIDVILAHRLLKNSVAAQEYLLMTQAAHELLGDFAPAEPEWRMEYCDGIGAVEIAIFPPPAKTAAAYAKKKCFAPASPFCFELNENCNSARVEFTRQHWCAPTPHVVEHLQLRLNSGPSP